MYFTMNTRSKGDGSEACYVVYFEREIVATFPINNPALPDAREYATRFIDTMNGYHMRRLSELPKRETNSEKIGFDNDCQ